MNSYTELWFDKHYRVIAVDLGDGVFVSIDVYMSGFPWSIDAEACLSSRDYCILYHRVRAEEIAKYYGELAGEALFLEIVGVRAGDRLETTDVRILFRKNAHLSKSDLENLYSSTLKLLKSYK
ncbi:MAG: hypothetical protein QW521_01335 [Desulfurococcaceae archaeon]